MSTVSEDRKQVERIATLARLTLTAVRDALAKTMLTSSVDIRLDERHADIVHLSLTGVEFVAAPAPSIQNIDTPAGWLEAQSDFTVRFIPHD